MLSPRFLLTILLVFPVLALGTMSCATTAIVDLDKVSIEQIINSPPEFESKSVTVAGEYRGWQAENGYGPPVTRSDWIVKDDTGWIYVTGEGPGVDPTEDIGCPIEVRSMVRVTDEGVP